MTRALAGAAGALLLALHCALGFAQAQPIAGRDFIVLDAPQPVPAGPAIEVIEFFYYGCPVCYESQQHLAAFLARAGDGVSLRRVPAASFEAAENFARIYYALEATGHLAQLHGAVYENHHFDDQRLGEEKNLLDWLARNGIDAEVFRTARDSAATRARVAEARRTFESYGVRAVPTFVVDGKYLTSARLANGVKEMMDVVEHLVDRARAERRR